VNAYRTVSHSIVDITLGLAHWAAACLREARRKEVIDMAKSAKVKATLVDAVDVKAVWEMVPNFVMGDVSLNEFTAICDAADSLDKEYAKKDVELTNARVNRDEKARQLADLVTRFRSGIRSIYGPDSPMYEKAGGTRSSLRKSRRPTEAAPATNAAARSNA
jgi:hypothetical protein